VTYSPYNIRIILKDEGSVHMSSQDDDNQGVVMGLVIGVVVLVIALAVGIGLGLGKTPTPPADPATSTELQIPDTPQASPNTPSAPPKQ